MDVYGELKKKKLTPRKDINSEKIKKDKKEKPLLKREKPEKKERKEEPRKKEKKGLFKKKPEDSSKTKIEQDAIKAKEMRQEDLWDKSEKKTTPLKAIKSMSKRSRNGMIITGVIIGYVLFLIYGAFNSEFVPDENGNPVPVVKSADMVSKQEGYREMREFYDAAVTKYKEIIDIDLKLSESGGEKKYAAYYTYYLDYFDKYIARLKAVETSTEFTLVKEQLVAWVSNDICVYLQNAQDAVSQNSKEKESNALQDRQRIIDDYYILTDNLQSLGKDVEGVDNNFDFDPVKEYNKNTEDKK